MSLALQSLLHLIYTIPSQESLWGADEECLIEHGDPLAWAMDFFRLQEPDSLEAPPASPDYVPSPEEPK
ncbi:hypothetical protein Tco_0964495 [Tanacetum coccineum]